MKRERTIYTVGHSTRPAGALEELLLEQGVELLVDVRRFPASRRHPHFAQAELANSLRRAGIEYRHEIDLGGRRKTRADSPNTAWRNASFRGYADHVQTEAFESALARVLDQAAARPTAIMCAEAHPSRCHRRIISDLLTLRGWRVRHVIERDRVEDHVLDESARSTADGSIVYPAPRQQDLEFEG